MARVWKLQEAKNKFSEVVDEALRHVSKWAHSALQSCDEAMRR